MKLMSIHLCKTSVYTLKVILSKTRSLEIQEMF